MDYTHVLKKYVYQLASRSPHSLATPNNDTDQSNAFSGEDVSSHTQYNDADQSSDFSGEYVSSHAQ
jgi:hypothetical protein